MGPKWRKPLLSLIVSFIAHIPHIPIAFHYCFQCLGFSSLGIILLILTIRYREEKLKTWSFRHIIADTMENKTFMVPDRYKIVSDAKPLGYIPRLEKPRH